MSEIAIRGALIARPPLFGDLTFGVERPRRRSRLLTGASTAHRFANMRPSGHAVIVQSGRTMCSARSRIELPRNISLFSPRSTIPGTLRMLPQQWKGVLFMAALWIIEKQSIPFFGPFNLFSTLISAFLASIPGHIRRSIEAEDEKPTKAYVSVRRGELRSLQRRGGEEGGPVSHRLRLWGPMWRTGGPRKGETCRRHGRLIPRQDITVGHRFVDDQSERRKRQLSAIGARARPERPAGHSRGEVPARNGASRKAVKWSSGLGVRGILPVTASRSRCGVLARNGASRKAVKTESERRVRDTSLNIRRPSSKRRDANRPPLLTLSLYVR